MSTYQRRRRRPRPAPGTLHWSGPRLFRTGDSEPCISIVPDPDAAFAWRVRLPDGTLSDPPTGIGAARVLAEQIVKAKAA